MRDPNEYFGMIFSAREHGIQAYMNGWAADYPGAGGFIDVQFRCGAASDSVWTEIDHRLVEEAVRVPL